MTHNTCARRGYQKGSVPQFAMRTASSCVTEATLRCRTRGQVGHEVDDRRLTTARMKLMEQGWAAVVAGVAGLAGAVGGAAVGGAAAIWGARQQVRDQADRDHRRWIREERQKAYAHVLEAFTAYGAYAEVVTVKLWEVSEGAAEVLSDADWDQLRVVP